MWAEDDEADNKCKKDNEDKDNHKDNLKDNLKYNHQDNQEDNHNILGVFFLILFVSVPLSGHLERLNGLPFAGFSLVAFKRNSFV